MAEVSVVSAFVAGVWSFVSPGLLPLIPGYLSFISGVSLGEMRELRVAKRQVAITPLSFIVGFSLVFIALGASASSLGRFLTERLNIFVKIAGVLLVILGLHTIGVFKIPSTSRSALIGAVIVGSSFAFGWTPYIGPILSAILLVAAQQDSVGQGLLLLSIYSLGLAVPLLLTALAINQCFVAFSMARRYSHTIELVSGAVMIVVGVLIFTNRFTAIAQWLTPYLPGF